MAARETKQDGLVDAVGAMAGGFANCNGISDSATAGDAWPLLDSFLSTPLIHLEGITEEFMK